MHGENLKLTSAVDGERRRPVVLWNLEVVPLLGYGKNPLWEKPTLEYSAVVGIYYFNHSIVYLTTGPKPLPKPVRHWVRSSSSPVSFQDPLFSLKSSSSSLRHLSVLPVTSILLSTFPSVTCFAGQLLPKCDDSS